MGARELVTRIVDEALWVQESAHKGFHMSMGSPIASHRKTYAGRIVGEGDFESVDFRLKIALVEAAFNQLRILQNYHLQEIVYRMVDMEKVREKTIDLIVKIVED